MRTLSRRAFLKLGAAAAVAAAWPPALARAGRNPAPGLDEWPPSPSGRLGRMVWPWGVKILSRPNPDGAELGVVMPEEVVPIVREVVGKGIAYHTHVWYELPNGYVYAPYLQPVRNAPNVPLATLPPAGLWAEVTLPYVDARAEPLAGAAVVYRLYYSTIFKITEIHQAADGQVWYRAYTETEIRMYAPAEAFRIIPEEEIAPLSPEVTDKRLVINLTEQAVSAYEGQAEVYRARVSSGARYFGEDGQPTSGTPLGEHYLWQKRMSRHMQGGTVESGYDLPGIGWVLYFASNGAAIHSTYWHNDFGVPKSHGCINCRPEDAKWFFRWTLPTVPYQPGDISVNWDQRGTVVNILVEA